MAPITFADLSTPAGLKQLNDFFSSKSYVSGYTASRDDLAVYAGLSSAPSASSYPHAARWYSHISALVGPSFSGPSVGVAVGGKPSAAAAASAPAPASKPAPVAQAAPKAAPTPAPAADDDDDDDLDLFGEETEEERSERKARERRNEEIAKAHEAKRGKVVGKSSVVLDIKPWDDETDLKKMEEFVRKVQMPGLLWGAAKLVPIGYGIKKLQIMMTIEDDLVSVDAIIEDHFQSPEGEEFIQSCDVVAFNKI